MQSIVDPPPSSALARFDPGFGQRFLLTIETGEELGGDEPLAGHGPRQVSELAKFQAFCEREGVAPLYLADWPVSQSQEAAEILRGPLAAGKAEIGALLHPRVNPPFDEELSPHNLFAGNLPESLERAKFTRLCEAIETSFEAAPTIYRAGRYGAGPHTAGILSASGIAVDSSVRARFDYSAEGGPDYRRHPPAPYWLDKERHLLELPLTTAFWGPLRRQGDWLHPALDGSPRLREWFARMSLLQRIPLTQEGVSVDEAIRAIDIALDDGLALLVFSFGSRSLRPGHGLWVRDEADLEEFYDWWRRVFAYLELRGVAPATVADVMHAVRR